MARKENNMIAELQSTQEAVTNRNYKAEKCREGETKLKTLSKKCHRNQSVSPRGENKAWESDETQEATNP